MRANRIKPPPKKFPQARRLFYICMIGAGALAAELIAVDVYLNYDPSMFDQPAKLDDGREYLTPKQRARMLQNIQP